MAFVQACGPVSAEPPKVPSHSHGGSQKQENLNQAESASTPVHPPVAAPCSKENPCYVQDAALEKALPRWRRPDWVIVYVTIIYSFITWLTLRSIKRQADLLERQINETNVSMEASSKIASDTLIALKQQASAMDTQNAAIRKRERARLMFIFPPRNDPDFSTPWRTATDEGEEMMFKFGVGFRNHGISKAFSVKAGMNFQIRDKDSPFVHDFFMDVPVPNVIPGGEEGDDPLRIWLETLISVAEVDKVSNGTAELHVYGQITYVDVFDDRRTAPFRFVWSLDEWEDSDGAKRFSGGWENCTEQKKQQM